MRSFLSQAIRQVLMSWCALSLWTTGLPAQTQNEIVGMGYDYKPEFAAARGQVITLRVKRLNVPSAKATSIPLPTLLSGVGVRVTSRAFDNYPQRLPIFSIISSDPSDGCCPLTYITVEIPTNAGVNTILLALEVDGNAGPSFQMAITDRQPHIVNACDTIVDTGICSTLVQH